MHIGILVDFFMEPVANVCLCCVIQYTSASRYRVRSKSQHKGQALHRPYTLCGTLHGPCCGWAMMKRPFLGPLSWGLRLPWDQNIWIPGRSFLECKWWLRSKRTQERRPVMFIVHTVTEHHHVPLRKDGGSMQKLHSMLVARTKELQQWQEWMKRSRRNKCVSWDETGKGSLWRPSSQRQRDCLASPGQKRMKMTF